MAVYNGGSKLIPSIESILNQTYSDFELIVVDDASNDETASVLREYGARDPRIIITTNDTNIGLTKSLNKGINKASGVYIARMDVGDTSEPERFAQQVVFLDIHPEYGLVGAWAHVIDERSKKIGEMNYPTGNDVLKQGLIKHNLFVHSSVMMRKSALDAVGLYDERWKYAQDYELFLRLAAHTNIANLPFYLASYRISPDSITKRKNKAQVMFAIHARVAAIKRGQYPFFSCIHLITPFIGYLLPYNFKQWLKKML